MKKSSSRCRSSARTGETTQHATNAIMSAITAVHSFPKEIMRCLAVYSFPEYLPGGPPDLKRDRTTNLYRYNHTQCEMPHYTLIGLAALGNSGLELACDASLPIVFALLFLLHTFLPRRILQSYISFSNNFIIPRRIMQTRSNRPQPIFPITPPPLGGPFFHR